jgi:hypothetical protein
MQVRLTGRLHVEDRRRLNVEGRIVGGVITKKRNIIELRNLHTIVEQKTANIIAILPYGYL